MTISYQAIEWLLTFLLGVEAFQLEIVWLIALFMVTMFSNHGSGHFRIRASKELAALFFAFLIYYLTLFIQFRATLSIFYIIRAFLGASFAYVIGMKVCKGEESKLLALIEIIAISSFLHGFLNIATTTTISAASRYVHNVWTGGITTATLQGTYFTCAIAVASLWTLGKSFLKKVFGCLILIATIWNSMMTASRTAVFMVFILFIASYFLVEYRRKEKKAFVGIVIRTIIGLAVVAFLIYVAYSSNSFGIQTRINSSYLGLRIASISKEMSVPRSELWSLGISNILAHPFGYDKDIYAHNLWIDFGLNGGVAPFVLLVFFSIASFTTCGRLVKRGNISDTTKSMVILSNIAFNINFMVEPILDGVPFMFFMYCMICGAVQETYLSSLLRQND